MAYILSMYQLLKRCRPLAILFEKKCMEKVTEFSAVGSLLSDILQYLLRLFLLYFSTGEVEPIVNNPVDIPPYIV